MSMQTIKFLFAVLLGALAGYGLAKLEERARHRRIWRRVVADLDWDRLKREIWGDEG